MFSYQFCEISKNTFFYRTPLVAASGGPKTKPCGTPVYQCILIFAYWDERVVNSLPNNSEVGSRACFLHHTAWVFKLNHQARPCQRLLKYLETVPLALAEELQSKDLYILCVKERNCGMQKSLCKKWNLVNWHLGSNLFSRKKLNKELKRILSNTWLKAGRRLIGLYFFSFLWSWTKILFFQLFGYTPSSKKDKNKVRKGSTIAFLQNWIILIDMSSQPWAFSGLRSF